MDLKSLTLRSGLRLISSIANHLARSIEENKEPIDAYVRKPAPLPRDCEALALIALAEYRWRRARARHFPQHLFGEPAWDILLDLYIMEVRGNRQSVTSACGAATVAPTTALRWLDALCGDELVCRRPDDHDQRRSFVSLTDAGRARIEAYLTAQMSGFDRPDSWMFADFPAEPLAPLPVDRAATA